MPELLSNSSPIARKRHFCDHCGCGIEKGQRYIRAAFVDGGRAYSWASHEDCQALAIELWREYGLGFSDDGICLMEEEWSELKEWRGSYPHVICRMELRRDLAGRGAREGGSG